MTHRAGLGLTIQLDPTHPKQQHKEKVPCMTTPSVSPAVVALDGKIYIFGGVHPCNQEQQLPWAESLDVAASIEQEKVWTPLASPPCDLWFNGLFAVVVDDGENCSGLGRGQCGNLGRGGGRRRSAKSSRGGRPERGNGNLEAEKG